ncbi:MAG: helix-turn-helix domain-containing protein [Pseudomonadota bacterium]
MSILIETFSFPLPVGVQAMPQMMTTKELAQYLKLNEITVCKYAAEGRIPAIRIGRVWRFDKEVIDQWIAGGQNNPGTNDRSREKSTRKKDGGKGGTAKNA